MRAARIHRYGGPEELVVEEAPEPEPGPGEVLVRVHAAGVNPVDWKTRGGKGMARIIGPDFPLVLGWDVSGTVVTTSPDARRYQPGDEVFGLVRFPQAAGCYADYVTAPESELVPKPSSLSHTEAAALPLASLTAWQALFDTARLEAGQSVLVHAAAGGVGHMAVQLAKARGARVTGTASAANAEFLRSLGVDQAVDYGAGPFEEEVSDVDVVLDSVGGEVTKRSGAVLRSGGTLVSIVDREVDKRPLREGARAAYLLVRPEGSQLAEVASMVEAGQVRPVVSEELPLEEAARAHQMSESGHTRGKLVLRVAE